MSCKACLPHPPQNHRIQYCGCVLQQYISLLEVYIRAHVVTKCLCVVGTCGMIRIGTCCTLCCHVACHMHTHGTQKLLSVPYDYDLLGREPWWFFLLLNQNHSHGTVYTHVSPGPPYLILKCGGKKSVFHQCSCCTCAHVHTCTHTHTHTCTHTHMHTMQSADWFK